MTDSILNDIWSKVKAVRIDTTTRRAAAPFGEEIERVYPSGRSRRDTFHTASDRAVV